MSEQGERGEKGDQGQHGQTGDAGERGRRGLAGETGRLTAHAKLAFVVLTLVFVALLSVTGYQIDRNRALGKQGEEAHDALCVLNQDLERRVASARVFLKENPDGISGIPAATIRTSITNQEATLEALRHLDCTKEE